MGKIASLLTGVMCCAASALAAPNGAWKPNEATLRKLESVVEIPIFVGAQPLKKYARYYAGMTANGRPMVRAEFVIADDPKKPAGRYVVSTENDFPIIEDGGCVVVNLLYDVKLARVVWVRCNGLA
jgi:hypothetical protein